MNEVTRVIEPQLGPRVPHPLQQLAPVYGCRQRGGSYSMLDCLRSVAHSAAISVNNLASPTYVKPPGVFSTVNIVRRSVM